MAPIKLAQANAIIDAAIAQGRQRCLSPPAVAVLDGGVLITGVDGDVVGAVGISGDLG